MRGIVQVVSRVHQPVRVKHHNGVDTQGTAAPINFVMPVNGGLACAFLWTVQLAQIHGRHVRDFGSE